MTRTLQTTIASTLLAAGLAGCTQSPPPPPRQPIPPVGTYTELRPVREKPVIPTETGSGLPFEDAPLITQAPPEQGAFVAAYRQVGAPRIALFVNRTLDGQIVDTVRGPAVSGTAYTRETTTGVRIETTRERLDPYGRPIDARTDRFETQGPGRVTDRVETFLAPGEYDAVQASRIDYDAVEAVMTSWVASGGKVTIVSPRLTETQTAALQKGDRGVLLELAKTGTIDVLIHVQMKPTRQTPAGLELRLIAEAINTAGGESLGRAFVDVPPPLEKPVINEYTRGLARMLMRDLTSSWSAPAPARNEAPPPGDAGPQSLPPQPPLVAPPTPGESVPPTTSPTQLMPPSDPS